MKEGNMFLINWARSANSTSSMSMLGFVPSNFVGRALFVFQILVVHDDGQQRLDGCGV